MCWRGRRRRVSLSPREACRNQGREIFRLKGEGGTARPLAVASGKQFFIKYELILTRKGIMKFKSSNYIIFNIVILYSQNTNLSQILNYHLVNFCLKHYYNYFNFFRSSSFYTDPDPAKYRNTDSDPQQSFAPSKIKENKKEMNYIRHFCFNFSLTSQMFAVIGNFV